MIDNREAFFFAYVNTALWSSVNGQGEPLDSDHGPEDIADVTLDRMRIDCNRFLDDNSRTIQSAIDTGKVIAGPDFDGWGRAGHDFWLTRNGHGAGFWDGDWPDPEATVLSDAAQEFGGVDLYEGDDGFIYDL